MKVYLHIEKHNLEYLNKILRNYNNIIDSIAYSFQSKEDLVMVSISYDDYLFLADHNAFKEI
jgi:hypothetical protein